MCFRIVVFPDPRKPPSSVTGTEESSVFMLSETPHGRGEQVLLPSLRLASEGNDLPWRPTDLSPPHVLVLLYPEGLRRNWMLCCQPNAGSSPEAAVKRKNNPFGPP
mmetsp:Transcript_45021/g.141741  ORF Transcript_45021/g.141741 Transcript_45021/m.141741 type:complete len:106 (-) Transcript_45021:12-329(-)